MDTSSRNRFIIAAACCCLNPHPKKENFSALKCCIRYLKGIILNLQVFSQAKSFLPVENNEAIPNTINKLKHLSLFSTYDFSNLYTNIPHDKLKYAMKQNIDFYFKDMQDKYIVITKYDATWVNNTNKYNISLDLKLAINFLLNQRFLNVDTLSFSQIFRI